MLDWWSGLTDIEAALAVVGGVSTLVFIAYFLLSDMLDGDADGGDVFALLSLRNVSAFLIGLCYFSLGLMQMAVPTWLAVGIGCVVGGAAVWLNVILLKMLSKMHVDGNWSPGSIVPGTRAEVTIEIGAAKSSSGKVEVLVNGQRREVQALTETDQPLKRQSTVEIAGIDADGQLLVIPDLKSRIDAL